MIVPVPVIVFILSSISSSNDNIFCVVEGMKMRSKVQANGSPKAKERNSIVSLYSIFSLTNNVLYLKKVAASLSET